MLSERELSAAIGSTAYDGSGAKIGTVEHFFVDDRTGQPTWVAISTGLFGTRVSLVPLRDCTWDGNALTIPFDKTALKTAPQHEPGTALSPSDEDDLHRHYGSGKPESTVDAVRDSSDDSGIRDEIAADTDDDDALKRTRSADGTS